MAQNVLTAERLPGRGDDLLAGARPQRILVLGGTGMLGQPVVRRLLADGYRVRVLSRSPDRARALLGEDCEVAGGDADDLPALEAALRGCQGAHLSLHGLMDPDLERRAAANVARLAGPAGVQRLTYLSGLSVCPENCWFKDTQARYEAEGSLHACGVPASIFRCNFLMETLHRFVRGRFGIVPGRQHLAFHFVAAEDFARMLSRAYALPEAADKVFYVYGPKAYTLREALRIFCSISRPDVWVVQFPLWLLGLIAWVGRRTEARDALPLFRYMQRARLPDPTAPEEANALLGAPTITLEEWSRQRRDAQRAAPQAPAPA
jgi:uncharacterized protein YbjT (DUF2867 family)